MSEEISLEILSALDYNEVQAYLINEITTRNEPHLNMIALINSCDWPIEFRIICGDSDSKDRVLLPDHMCKLDFKSRVADETLVFCQTWALGDRTMNFDAWGGKAPRGLNVWSVLPDLDEGLALSGLTVKKGWNVQEDNGFAEDNELSEDEYFHKSHDDKEPAFSFLASPANYANISRKSRNDELEMTF